MLDFRPNVADRQACLDRPPLISLRVLEEKLARARIITGSDSQAVNEWKQLIEDVTTLGRADGSIVDGD